MTLNSLLANEEFLGLVTSLRVAYAEAQRHAAGERFHGSEWAAYGCQILRNKIRILIEQELSRN